jgi:hypothetical protein
MPNNKLLLNALTIAGLGQLTALSLLLLPTDSVFAANNNESAKIQRFDLSKMSVGDLGNLKNESLKQLLMDSNNNNLVAHDSHSSTHSKNTRARTRPGDNIIKQNQNPAVKSNPIINLDKIEATPVVKPTIDRPAIEKQR